MAIDWGIAVANQALDEIDAEINGGGGAGKLQGFTTTQPSDCATADAGAEVFEITLPATAFADASAGAMVKAGTWSCTGAATTGNAAAVGYFRVKDSADVCVMQGTVGQGSGDLSLDNSTVAAGQTVTISTFTLTFPSF